MSSLRTIASYTDLLQAHLARGRLEAEGIPSVIADEHHIAANWLLSNALGGVKIQVEEHLSEQAEQIIRNFDNGVYALAEENEVLQCPQCRSNRIEELRRGWKIAFLGFFVLELPIPYRRNWYLCQDCQNKWRKN